MTRLLTFLLALALAAPAAASVVIFYDDASPVVADRVTSVRRQAHTPAHADGPAVWVADRVTNPLPNRLIFRNMQTTPLPALKAAEPATRYWKRSGTTVVEMTQGEKDDIDDANEPLPQDLATQIPLVESFPCIQARAGLMRVTPAVADVAQRCLVCLKAPDNSYNWEVMAVGVNP